MLLDNGDHVACMTIRRKITYFDSTYKSVETTLVITSCHFQFLQRPQSIRSLIILSANAVD